MSVHIRLLCTVTAVHDRARTVTTTFPLIFQTVVTAERCCL